MRSSSSVVTNYRLTRDTLLIDLGRPHRVLSSAPHGGGLIKTRYILNHQVAPNPITAPAKDLRWSDPGRYLANIAEALGADRGCVALMTAVSLNQLVTLCVESGDLRAEGFFTVGVSNAVRVGELARPSPEGDASAMSSGTINMILLISARLTASAMVGAVQVATEGKTAALLAAGVPSWTGTQGATGTGTDTVVVVAGNGPFIRYSGTHTKIGEMIGQLVCQGVTEGLRRASDSHRARVVR